MYISPHFQDWMLPEKPINEWPIELLINIFQDATDGWHLNIADRCINGWKDANRRERIQARHLDNSPANYIPDSGWAVLQIVLNYFEVIGFFKSGGTIEDDQERFKSGFFDVFTELSRDRHGFIAYHVWRILRVQLYHGNIPNDRKKNKQLGQTILIHTMTSPEITGDTKTKDITIDPHRLVKRLRSHLAQYCDELRNPEEIDLRSKFQEAFLTKYG